MRHILSLHLNADNLDEILQAYRELYPAIPLKDVYMFFDEVQMADDWQPFVRRVYEQECRHIFLTGSNSRMLSSELATSLRGRTLQYEEFPLSFNEFCNFTDINTNYYVPENRAKLVNGVLRRICMEEVFRKLYWRLHCIKTGFCRNISL